MVTGLLSQSYFQCTYYSLVIRKTTHKLELMARIVNWQFMRVDYWPAQLRFKFVDHEEGGLE